MFLLKYQETLTSELIQISVPSSKSASNRALVIRALCQNDYIIQNLSSARDTIILNELIQSDTDIFNALDAGTVIRFLCAYLAFKTDKSVSLVGTERAHDRPIGILVSALRELGAKIDYLDKPGFPPLKIHPSSLNKSSDIQISGDVSSQFISAIMMIAPLLENGLTLRLQPPVISQPYIDMTLEMMCYHEIEAAYVSNIIRINRGKYVAKAYRIEADWSSAVFLYGFCLTSGKNIFIPNLTLDSGQADSEIHLIMDALGICSEQKKKGVLITNSGVHPEIISWDCTDCPDLVPGLCFGLAAKGISADLQGTRHLKHKESDRGIAIKNELTKLGVQVDLGDNSLQQSGIAQAKSVEISTYRDHRMAMAAALLSPVIDEISIGDPEVVEKSFPEFWREMNSAGLTLAKL